MKKKVIISQERAVILLSNLISEIDEKAFEKIEDLESYLKLEVGVTDEEWKLIKPSLKQSNVIK